MKIFKISISAFVIFSALIVSIGSILFGYNSAVISGALLFLADEFSLDFWELGLLVSSLVLGAAIGSAIGGIIADRYGRKVGFFITAILFILGTFYHSIYRSVFNDICRKIYSRYSNWNNLGYCSFISFRNRSNTI